MGKSTQRVASGGRNQARRIYPKPLGACVLCGKPASDRHHKDGDTFNNHPTNISFLCRRCHMLVDGRLGRLATGPRATKPRMPCMVCGKVGGYLRRGRCHACNEYYRRHDGVDVLPENRVKTHCPHGHQYDDVNTYWNGNQRSCRTCHMLNQRRYRAVQHMGGDVR